MEANYCKITIKVQEIFNKLLKMKENNKLTYGKHVYVASRHKPQRRESDVVCETFVYYLYPVTER